MKKIVLILVFILGITLTISPVAAEHRYDYTLEELEGTTFRMAFWEEAFGILIRDNLVEEFEEETGINVEYETIADYQRRIAEAISESGYYNAYRISSHEPAHYIPAGWAADLEPYFEQAEKEGRPRDFAPDDILDSAWDSHTGGGVYDGMHAIPMNVNIRQIFYRRSLFEDPNEQEAFKEEYGYELKPPETTDELLDVGEFFTREAGEMLAGEELNEDFYGFTVSHEPGTRAWIHGLDLIHTFGGEFVSAEEGSLVKDYEEEIIRAFEWGVKTKDIMPGAVTEFGPGDNFSFLADGNAAMGMVWYAYYYQFWDEEMTLYPGDWLNIPMVRDPETGFETGKTAGGGGSFVVDPFGDPKEIAAAAEFGRWIFSKEGAWELAKIGGLSARHSVLDRIMHEEEILAENPGLEETLPAFAKGLEHQLVPRPTIPEVDTVNDELAIVWERVFRGDITPAQGVEELHRRVERILN